MIIVVMLKLCIRNSNSNNSNNSSSIIKRNFMKITIKCKHIFKDTNALNVQQLMQYTIVWLNINCLTLIENFPVLSLFVVLSKVVKWYFVTTPPFISFIFFPWFSLLFFFSFMHRICRGCGSVVGFINNNNDWQLWWWQFFYILLWLLYILYIKGLIQYYYTHIFFV